MLDNAHRKQPEPTFTTAVLIGIVVMLAICVAVMFSDDQGASIWR